MSSAGSSCLVECYYGGGSISYDICPGLPATSFTQENYQDVRFMCESLGDSVPQCPLPPGGSGGDPFNDDPGGDDGTGSGTGSGEEPCPAGQVRFEGGLCGYP